MWACYLNNVSCRWLLCEQKASIIYCLLSAWPALSYLLVSNNMAIYRTKFSKHIGTATEHIKNILIPKNVWRLPQFQLVGIYSHTHRNKCVSTDPLHNMGVNTSMVPLSRKTLHCMSSAYANKASTKCSSTALKKTNIFFHCTWRGWPNRKSSCSSVHRVSWEKPLDRGKAKQENTTQYAFKNNHISLFFSLGISHIHMSRSLERVGILQQDLVTSFISSCYL